MLRIISYLVLEYIFYLDHYCNRHAGVLSMIQKFAKTSFNDSVLNFWATDSVTWNKYMFYIKHTNMIKKWHILRKKSNNQIIIIKVTTREKNLVCQHSILIM